MIDLDEVIRQYRSGLLTPEDAAAMLFPALQAEGTLQLPLTEKDMPLLDALSRMARPPLPAAQPLTWDAPVWRALPRLAELLWPSLRADGLDQRPQCLNYVFLVASPAAAAALRQRIETTSDHRVTDELPDNYAEHLGRVSGQLPAGLVTEAGLNQLAAWLQAFPPVPDATLELINLTDPPEPGGTPAGA